jgi:hypothetical protein
MKSYVITIGYVVYVTVRGVLSFNSAYIGPEEFYMLREVL